jgi:putative heme-binding domain-containing protein
MIASETDAELSVKVPGGVIVKVAKPELASRNKLPVSLMTPGLASVMKEEEFVDLIEYLTALKKK